MARRVAAAHIPDMTIVYAPRSARRKPTARPTEPTSANADRPPVIVTGRKPGEQRAGLPEMTPEEHERRGDAEGWGLGSGGT